MDVEMGPQHVAKWLIVTGFGLVALGLLILGLGRLGLFRLPGDLEFGGKNWKVYFPIASSIVLSLILTLILWLINHLRR
jgi:hypothetical protein